jgi:hypothetical protein
MSNSSDNGNGNGVQVAPIFNKVWILTLKLRNFNVVKKVKKSERKHVQHPANDDWVKISQKILDSKEIKAIQDLFVEIYTFLSWKEGPVALPCLRLAKGQYLIPCDAVDMVVVKLKAFEAQLNALKAKIPEVFYVQVEEAKVQLGPMWNQKHYKPLKKVLATITMEWDFEVLGTLNSADGVSAHLVSELREKMSQRLDLIETQATKILRSLLLQLFKKIADKLTPGKKGRKKPIPEDYLKDLRVELDNLLARNIFDDKLLMEQIEFLRQKFSVLDIDSLNSDKDLRGKIKKEIQQAMNTFDQMSEDSGFDDVLGSDLEELMDLQPFNAADALIEAAA